MKRMRMRLDRRIWYQGTVLAMVTETAIAFNLDAYSASIPVWFKKDGHPIEMLDIVMGVAILATMLGGFASGPLLDRFGTRRVQGTTLGVMLIAAAGTSFAQNWVEMMILQTTRDFVSSIAIVSCGMRARALLPSSEDD